MQAAAAGGLLSILVQTLYNSLPPAEALASAAQAPASVPQNSTPVQLPDPAIIGKGLQLDRWV